MEIGGHCALHHRPPPFARGLPSFEDIDADTSGGISLEEYTDAAKSRRNGRASDPERIEKRFARIDSDADGSLSSDELSAFRARFRPETSGALIGAQEGAGKGDKPSLEDRLADLFAKLDADGDGALSLSELVAAVKNLPGGNNGQGEEGSSATDGDGSDGATAGSDAASEGEVAAGSAVEDSVTAVTDDEAAGAAAATEATVAATDATVTAAAGASEASQDEAESPRDRWHARLESWSERFGDAWRDRFADSAERWHDRWADRLADRADGGSGRTEAWRDRWAERAAERGTGTVERAGAADIAGALRELIALLREALGTGGGTAADTATVADAGGSDASDASDAGGAQATAAADAGTTGSDADTGSGGAAAADTAADTGTAADTTETVALGDVAIDRLAALLATRIEAYLKAGSQNAQAESTLSATA